MTVPAPSIRIYFGTTTGGGTTFTLSDSIKGVLDDTTYVLGGDTGTLVQSDLYSLNVRRGRSREVDEFTVGTCSGSLWNHDRTYDTENSLSALVGDVTPGKRITVSVWDQPIFDGVIEDWDLEWDVDQQATASFTAEDALGQLGRREFDAWTATGSQTAGDRLNAVLNRGEVNFPVTRNIDRGVTSLQGDSIEWNSNVLNYMQLVAKSDAGRLFATRDGTLRYQDRRSLVNAASGITFNDTGTGQRIHGITTTSSSDLLFNRVGVDREGGTLQTVEDATSQDAYGIRALNLDGLLMDSDVQAADMAGWFISLYKDPVNRISSITVKLHGVAAGSDRAAIAALDIGDVISVSWTPQRVGSPITQTLVVEGTNDALAPGTHVRTLYTSLANQLGVFVLDDAALGLLDTGGVLTF